MPTMCVLRLGASDRSGLHAASRNVALRRVPRYVIPASQALFAINVFPISFWTRMQNALLDRGCMGSRVVSHLTRVTARSEACHGLEHDHTLHYRPFSMSCLRFRFNVDLTWIALPDTVLCISALPFLGHLDICLPATFVTVFLLLRPEYLFLNDCADHAAEDKYPHANEQACHDTTQYSNRSVVEGSCYRERCSGESGVRKDEAVPGLQILPDRLLCCLSTTYHRKVHLVGANAGPVSANRDDEEEKCQSSHGVSVCHRMSNSERDSPPKPEPNPVGNNHRYRSRKVSCTHEVWWYHPREIACHVDDPRDREAGWTDTDKHSWSKAFLWQFLCHQPVEEG